MTLRSVRITTVLLLAAFAGGGTGVQYANVKIRVLP